MPTLLLYPNVLGGKSLRCHAKFAIFCIGNYNSPQFLEMSAAQVHWRRNGILWRDTTMPTKQAISHGSMHETTNDNTA